VERFGALQERPNLLNLASASEFHGVSELQSGFFSVGRSECDRGNQQKEPQENPVHAASIAQLRRNRNTVAARRLEASAVDRFWCAVVY